MKKKFEIPELVIVYFTGDLATDDDIIGNSGGFGGGGFGQPGDGGSGDYPYGN